MLKKSISFFQVECIDCNLCSEIAPNNFMVNEEGGHDFVYKQPENDEEEVHYFSRDLSPKH